MTTLAASIPSVAPVRASVPVPVPVSGARIRGSHPGALAMMFNPRGLWRFLRDPEASRASRVLAVLAMLYVISPIDLIPDWLVPVAGWLDDLGVATIALAWVASQAARYERTGHVTEANTVLDPVG